MTPSDPEGVEHLTRIDGVLERVYRRNGYEATEFATPLSELIYSEEEAGLAQDDREQELVRDARKHAFQAMLRYAFADGPHPGSSMRRLYALARAFEPDLIARMNGTDLAQIFDESRAAQSWRTLRMFDGYMKERGARSGKLPFQKSEDARALYSEAQLGNQNRRGKSGRKAAGSRSGTT